MKPVIACLSLCLLSTLTLAQKKEPDSKPPEIVINASPDKVKAALASEYLQKEFKVDNESTYQIAFWRNVKSPKEVYEPKHGTLHEYLKRNRYGEAPKEVITFKLLPDGVNTRVIVDVEISMRRFFGDTVRWSLLPDKNERTRQSEFLKAFKIKLES